MDDFCDTDPTEPFLLADERKKCCDMMRATGKFPRQATNKEIQAILFWLNSVKLNYPMFISYNYKDCCFQIDEGHKWVLSFKNNDLMFSEMLYGRSNLW